MKRLHKTVILVFSITLLFFAAQATRFENEVTVTYVRGNFTAVIDGVKLTFPVKEDFTQITANLQKAMLAENGIGRFAIMSDNKVLAEHDSVTLHLFGKDLVGNLIKGDHLNFRNTFGGFTTGLFSNTFGDWTMDRFSNDVVLYNASLPSHFSMEITFVGRGYKQVSFNGQQSMLVDINDGYLDNNYGICYKGECHGEEYKESTFINIKRISNFFIEAFLFALIIIFLIKLISKRGNLK